MNITFIIINTCCDWANNWLWGHIAMHGNQGNSVPPGGQETSECDSGFRPV